ncbi:polyamine oxidase (exo-N4-amino) 1 [Trichomycterus rosablanca]|uniref:polyamine oxidase (exo-N4-amino) 1 n=1 Tax=Trichomycterus rosablanca TaxID=2290929 RepID=UPI002F357B40
MQQAQQPRIVVIGAGAAGLGAATKLKALGFTDITLVEACETFGGRIAKTSIGKACVDTGAQYIHGASEKNPVFNLFKNYELLSQVPEEGRRIFYQNNGCKVDEDFSERVCEVGEKIIYQSGTSNYKSIGELFEKESQSAIENCEADKKKIMESILALVGKELMLDIGASNLHNVSSDSWQYFINMGEDLNVEGLMFQMLEKFAMDFPKEHLLLKKVVNKIEWDGSFPGKEGLVYPVRILCEDGGEILADHVIVTISLGCLKAQASTLFNPSLPPEKTEVIDKLCFGNLGKIFLEYEEAFWESDVSNISFVWEDDSVASLCTDKTQWLKYLQLFSVMRPKEKFGNILIGWCPGDIADLIETLPKEELTTAITEHIRKFIGNPQILPPKTLLCTQWRSNNFVRGALTFLPVGVDGKTMDILAEPLAGNKNPSKDLQVLFAGEATIKSLYGTVQGALTSGQREAERLAQHYGRTVPSTIPSPQT